MAGASVSRRAAVTFNHRPVFYVLLLTAAFCAGGSCIIFWATVRGTPVAGSLAIVIIAVMLIVGQIFGLRVRFMSHLMPNDAGFLRELKEHATECRSFDPNLENM